MTFMLYQALGIEWSRVSTTGIWPEQMTMSLEMSPN